MADLDNTTIAAQLVISEVTWWLVWGPATWGQVLLSGPALPQVG